jgi:hypothetical protein
MRFRHALAELNCAIRAAAHGSGAGCADLALDRGLGGMNDWPGSSPHGAAAVIAGAVVRAVIRQRQAPSADERPARLHAS